MKYVQLVPPTEFHFEAVRASGPGGQNVNKRSTAVALRWNLPNSSAFTAEEKLRITQNISTLLTGLGDILVSSQELRSQDQNRKRCLEKLDAILVRGLYQQKKRRKTKVPKQEKQKRRINKKLRSHIKKNRGKVPADS